MIDFPEALPERLAEAVSLRLAESNSILCAYWIKIVGDRSQYASRLRVALKDIAAAVFVVRDTSFSNPNSVASDVVQLLNVNKLEVQEVFAHAQSAPRLAVVMLGKTELTLAQASSLVTMPDWFPIAPGQLTDILVEDLSWTFDGPLNCNEAKVGELCEALYSLEAVLLRRLNDANSTSHNSGNAFMEYIRRTPEERYSELIDIFARSHSTVVNASAFRPSLRDAESLIARLWEIVIKRSPETLQKPSKAFAEALLVNAHIAVGAESLATVLCRPSNLDSSPGQRFARGVISTVASSCQYVTAAAHADYYSRYPIPLLIAFSYDLRNSLWAAENALRLMS